MPPPIHEHRKISHQLSKHPSRPATGPAMFLVPVSAEIATQRSQVAQFGGKDPERSVSAAGRPRDKGCRRPAQVPVCGSVDHRDHDADAARHEPTQRRIARQDGRIDIQHGKGNGSASR
jgi:hypothetical protein